MQSPNEFMAIFVMAFFALVAWGYRGSLGGFDRSSGVHWLMRGVAIISFSTLAMRFQWDVVIAIIWYVSSDAHAVARYVGNWLNAVWSGVLCCAGYCFLRALHLFIPADVRARYSVWTAAFYPGEPFARFEAQIGALRRGIRRKGPDDSAD